MSSAYSIEFRWKEEVVYWEGDHGYIFEGGWGVTPSVTYVPDEESWDDVVPAWMVGRRAEIVDRLLRHPGHVVEEYPRRTADYPREVHRGDPSAGPSFR